MKLTPLSSPPSTETVVLSDYSARPGDVMTFLTHGPAAARDNERALCWRAPDGQTMVLALELSRIGGAR